MKTAAETASDKEKAPNIRPLLRVIYPWGAVLTAVCFGISLVLEPSLKDLVGFGVGYGYMCLCMEYLARTCERAVGLEKKRAVRAMRVCYGVRYGGLFLICALLGLTGTGSLAAVVLPQLFPRMILTVYGLKAR